MTHREPWRVSTKNGLDSERAADSLNSDRVTQSLNTSVASDSSCVSVDRVVRFSLTLTIPCRTRYTGLEGTEDSPGMRVPMFAIKNDALLQ